MIRESPTRLDPHHQVTSHVEADVVSFCRELVKRVDDQRPDDQDRRATEAGSDWLRSWRSTSSRVEEVLNGFFAGSDALSEPAIGHIVSTTADEGLFLANSMPVRDVDSYGSTAGKAPLVASNRGASGIDGTVASAVGFARGLGGPVTLLIGDLALLHDLNSLALAAASTHPLKIVVVNNHGGGIFSFLPIARHTDVFETYFGTPHRYSFEHAAAMFSIPYEAPTNLPHLRGALEMSTAQTKLIEVTTDREENVRLHRDLEKMIARELGG